MRVRTPMPGRNAVPEQRPRRTSAKQGESPFRALPSVDELLRDSTIRDGTELEDAVAARLFGDVVARARADIASGAPLSRSDVASRAHAAVQALFKPRLSRLINATGIIVHTNLGRAPLSDATIAAMAEAGGSPVSLEVDPETNIRGSRMAEITHQFSLLTGAEAALVVNNNAAAVLLALAALAAGTQVIVSRGEAVEIGGGFRVPDVLRQSGAKLVEVGTTNRTYIADYERAIGPDTGALLRVHLSNFRMIGFTTAPSLEELVALGAQWDLPVLEDVGSGALLDTARVGLDHEPTLQESIAAGVGVVMASGDKLLGGPQAGILLGQRRWIEQIAKHPLARAVRADKTCLAGLAATLRHYLRGEAQRDIPVWQMMSATPEDLERRALALRNWLMGQDIELSVVGSEATVGGGSVPGQTLPSYALRFVPSDQQSCDELARRLRLLDHAPVYGRILDGGLQFDLRTVPPRDDDDLLESLRRVLSRTLTD